MKKIWLLACCFLLVSCGSVSVDDYAAEQPVLNLESYFSRPVQAWGMFQDRSGKVIKRFHVQIDSRREGDKLILDERFVYSDGSTQRRVWTLIPDGQNRWRGTADDVAGEAASTKFWGGIDQLDTLDKSNLVTAINELAARGNGGSTSGGVAYTHLQSLANTVWTINHNLGMRPAVTILDTGGNEVEADVVHTSFNQLVIRFAIPVAGIARLT